jgi:hypothetical protein
VNQFNRNINSAILPFPLMKIWQESAIDAPNEAGIIEITRKQVRILERARLGRTAREV